MGTVWAPEQRSEGRAGAWIVQVPRHQIAFIQEADDLEVRFDPSHLHQVAWNLCDNAVKYGEARKGISVEIKLGRLTPSNRPYLEVADRGPGIEPHAVDRIFEPFFTGRKGGTGLGLFIARELCQLNRAILLCEPGYAARVCAHHRYHNRSGRIASLVS
jgi:two-component system sensor histidine kinase PilS (NtrC family)